MHCLTDIPFTLDAAELMPRAHVDPQGEDAAAFAALVERARAVARPKALYREAFIDAKGPDTIRIGTITFTSRMLRANLDAAERVFAYVATCGHEMDEPEIPDDFLSPFWWDTIKAALLGAALTYAVDHIRHRYRLEKTSSMHPGSGDANVWPIQQQRELFALLDGVTPHIGVTLTDTCLMLPNKTVSGVLFPTARDFRSCQVCHRAECPNRSAPFDEALWKTLQHE
jgi:hypothetical protein